MKRFIFTFALVGAVIYAPWWAVFVAAGIGTFVFPRYLEVLFAGLLFDILYGATGTSFFGLGILGFTTSIVLFFSMEKIKQNLR